MKSESEGNCMDGDGDGFGFLEGDSSSLINGGDWSGCVLLWWIQGNSGGMIGKVQKYKEKPFVFSE